MITQATFRCLRDLPGRETSDKHLGRGFDDGACSRRAGGRHFRWHEPYGNQRSWCKIVPISKRDRTVACVRRWQRRAASPLAVWHRESL